MEFIDLLKANDMSYKFSEPNENGGYYQLMFGKKGTNFALTGTVIISTTVYRAFESALECLKEDLNEPK